MIKARPRAKIGADMSRSYPLAAPVGGWNARDALQNMPPEDAPILTNWWITPTTVDLRNGYIQWSTGYGNQVETVLAYAGGTTNKLFGIAGGSVFDATAGGAVGAAAVTGLSNSRWQYVNNATTGGNYLQMVNGADKMRVFDGTAWHKDGDGAPYDITGVNSANLSNINVHKFRVWFVQTGTLKMWYLATGAIGGAATQFDLSGTAMLGGYIVAMYTWTIDAGYGVDDMAVFITSRGEVIVYRGTDPSSATTWALVGIWRIGAPVGNRPCLKFAGDLLVICQDGVYPMSGALQSSRTNPKIALTDKIQSATSDAITSYGSNFGWQLVQFPKANMLLLNVPVSVGSQQQFVMNTISKNWTQFTGWAANCWELYQDNIYFGGNGFIGFAWNGLSDAGTNINADALQAFNYFKEPGVQKRFTMIRPTILTNGSPAIKATLNIDFDLNNYSSPISFSPINAATWDSAIWDSSLWGGGLNISQLWQSVGVYPGRCAGVRFLCSSQGIEVNWASTDIVYERGAIV